MTLHQLHHDRANAALPWACRRVCVLEPVDRGDVRVIQRGEQLRFTLEAKLAEIADSIRIQDEGFRALVAGTRVDFEELKRKAASAWYIEAEQARDLGLVLDVI